MNLLTLAKLAALLAVAGGSGDRIDLADLTHRFPSEPRQLMLAYEQSRDIVTLIANRYGPESIIGILNRLRAGETSVWDFINVNNPWARNVMWPAGLIRDLQSEAERQGLPLNLQVLQGNPARRLYERLGFAATGETETHIMMSWLPD